MAKDSKDRKKEKKEKKERKEKKRREAEELAVKEKKISKKHKSKSKSKEIEKPEKKPKKKSKKLEVEEKPHKKKPKKQHKQQDSSESEDSDEDPETVTVPSNDPHPIKLPLPPTTTNDSSDSDSDFDKEDIKHLLESYTKEDLINLIYKTAEKGSRLISAVLESADRDSSKRNIFVRGLGWDTTHETLKSAFEVFGEIEECSVVMDKDTGRAKGYGFVMFKTRKGCREALRNPEKRMFNRTVSCNLAAAKPGGAGKFQAREPVESVKIDLNQKEVVLPGVDLGYVHGSDKGPQHQQNMGMYGGGQNMPFYGHGVPSGFHPMYAAAFMGNQMGPGFNPMFGPGMMNHGPPNHMGMAGQYGGEGNGVGPGGFDGERAWYLR